MAQYTQYNLFISYWGGKRGQLCNNKVHYPTTQNLCVCPRSKTQFFSNL